MPGINLRASHEITHLIKGRPLGVGNIIVPISEMRKLRLRTNQQLIQGHTAAGEHRSLKPVLSDFKTFALPF